MDPLSISAGVVGFISFLHGVGTFMGKMVTAKQDEEEAIRQFNTDIQQLERILLEVQGYRQDLEDVFPGNQSVDFAQLEDCLEECRVKLEKFVDKLKNPNAKRRAMLNRLKWPLRQGKGKKILDLVHKYKSSLLLELAVKQGRAVHTTVLGTAPDISGTAREMQGAARDIQGTARDIQGTARDIHGTVLNIQTEASAMQQSTSIMQRAEIVKRVDIVDVNAAFDKAQEKHHSGTGNWFLKSTEFEDFQNEGGKHIWLHGMPGAGKTVLCGSIIAAMRAYVKDVPTYALAYFFFSYRSEDKQNVYNALSSITGQLCQKVKTIPEKVVKELECNMNRLPTSVLLESIACLCQCFYKVYILLDALDEIKSEERPSLIRMLQYIIGLPNINVLMTSRLEDYLINGFNRLPIQAMAITTTIVDADIRLYVSETISEAAVLWGWDSDLCNMIDEIVMKLSEGAKGMFRWVDCQMENLKNCRRVCDVEDTLCTLPEDLDETYKRILLSVEKRYQVYVARLLAWIIFTPKVLCAHILAEAIIFEPDRMALDPHRRFKNIDNVVGLCRNLITPIGKFNCCSKDPFDVNHSGLSLSHYSVKEYLVSERFEQEEDLTVYSSLLKKGPSYLVDVQIKYWQMATLLETESRNEMLSDSWPLLGHCILTSMKHGQCLQDKTERKQWAASLARLACNNFNVTEHALKTELTGNVWCPVSLFVRYDLYEGVEMCVSCGYNAHSIHWYYGQPVTSLSLAVMPSDHTHELDILFKSGAHDILDGPFGKYSPALVTALVYPVPVWTPDTHAIHVLLQHGSFINSPHYPTGSLIPFVELLSHWQIDQKYDEILQSLKAASPIHLPCFDHVFTASEGLTHSFIGETTEFYAAMENLSLLHNVLTQGVKIGKPVRQPNTITTLSRFFDLSNFKTVPYFSLNAFCATDFSDNFLTFSVNRWMDRVSLLLEYGGDINALDCIIGRGTNDEIIYLDYCTALDLLQALYELEREQGSYWGRSPMWPNSSPSCLLQAACILEKCGGKILPREPVSNGVWRIHARDYYAMFFRQSWYNEEIMHYDRQL